MTADTLAFLVLCALERFITRASLVPLCFSVYLSTTPTGTPALVVALLLLCITVSLLYLFQ